LKTEKRLALVVLIITTIIVSTVSVAYLFPGSASGTGGTPARGFLIIATADGYNESLRHGASGVSPWPIIQVHKGTIVNITVYNNDRQAHGFQIAHYFDSDIEAVAPGQRITISFIASETGKFTIFCSIFCTIHVFMQYGQLAVT